MISSVRGRLLHQGVGYVVIDVGGIGLRVEVPSGGRAPRFSDDMNASLYTVLIVRDDALTLFGFETALELEVFQQLITVSGVGPRSGLGVLSALTPQEIAQAVNAEDDKVFRSAPGIGPKTSKLLVVQLAGKLDHVTPDETSVSFAPAATEVSATVIEGLIGLGWSEPQAAQAVQDASNAGVDHTPAELMRAALALLQTQTKKGTLS